MTDEKLDRAIALRKELSNIEDILEQLNYDQCEYLTIEVVCSDGIPDYVCRVPEGCAQVIRQWYFDERARCKEEFDAL